MVYHDAPPESAVAEEPPRARPRRRAWPWILLASVIAAPAAIFALWAAITLNYSYSDGDRVGYVLKLSEKGWLCKTWEGELSMATVPGVMPEKWAFSVRADDVAQRIQAAQGQQVALTYEEHKGVPSTCFGETDYFVTDVKVVGPATPTVPPTAAPNTTPTPGAPTTTPPAGGASATPR